jgi:hypothetical protein
VQNIAAINDLISAESVHTEISNTVARIIQQVSSVATCLYTRVSVAQPIDRLTWAEYLRGAGLSVQMQSLAILPGWNQLAYSDRQQMQLLVDWLFLQIDTTNSAATAFMSDVVRTAILLASDVPVDNIIPGGVIARTLPAIGRSRLAELAFRSHRVGHVRESLLRCDARGPRRSKRPGQRIGECYSHRRVFARRLPRHHRHCSLHHTHAASRCPAAVVRLALPVPHPCAFFPAQGWEISTLHPPFL